VFAAAVTDVVDRGLADLSAHAPHRRLPRRHLRACAVPHMPRRWRWLWLTTSRPRPSGHHGRPGGDDAQGEAHPIPITLTLIAPDVQAVVLDLGALDGVELSRSAAQLRGVITAGDGRAARGVGRVVRASVPTSSSKIRRNKVKPHEAL
jgi:hypothetical protein